MLELNDHLRRHLPKDHTFDRLLDCHGTVHRHVKHRQTVEFHAGGRRYFIKVHRGCGWHEIFKDLLQGRLPVTGAQNEWRAIERLGPLGVSTMTIAGRGLRGRNPARQESFIITEALEGMITLEDLPRDWGGLTGSRQKLLKRALLERVVAIARILHTNGLNHRDFYLCHFLVRDRTWPEWQPGDPLELHLIDLHRAQIRQRVPWRWKVKDLAGLFFSAMDFGLTRRDCLRFIRLYRQRPLRETLEHERRFWTQVQQKAKRLYRSVHGHPVPVPFDLDH